MLQISPDYSVGTCSPSSLTPAVMPAQFKALSSESCARAHRRGDWRAGFDHYSDKVSLSSFARVVPRIKTIIIAPLSTQLGVEVRSQFMVDR